MIILKSIALLAGKCDRYKSLLARGALMSAVFLLDAPDTRYDAAKLLSVLCEDHAVNQSRG